MSSFRRFRKKTNLVVAIQLGVENAEEAAKFCGGISRIESKPSDPRDVSVQVVVPTVQGLSTCNKGSWILRVLENNRIKVMSDREFNELYEEDPNHA